MNFSRESFNFDLDTERGKSNNTQLWIGKTMQKTITLLIEAKELSMK